MREFLRDVKNGRFRDEVEKIRSLIREGNEEEVRRLKLLVPVALEDDSMPFD